MRKAEASAGTSLPHLAAVPRLEICPCCHGEQGESANESLESEHGSTPAKIPCSSDGLGLAGGGGAEVPAAGAFSAGSPLSMKWFGGNIRFYQNIPSEAEVACRWQREEREEEHPGALHRCHMNPGGASFPPRRLNNLCRRNRSCCSLAGSEWN